MLRLKKALLILMLLTLSLACNLTTSVRKAIGNQVGTQIAAQFESEVIATPTPTFNVGIRTEVISQDDFLSVTKNFSSVDPTTGLNHVYVVLENNSTDPLDIITEFTGKITWFDENNEVIDELEIIGMATNIFPQEKRLYSAYVDRDKVQDRTISQIRVELNKVTTVKSYQDSGLKDKISSQEWSHPFATTEPGTFEIKPYLIDYAMGITKVAVQNTINSAIKPAVVVGLYYNENDELVGIGKSERFELPALGSAEVDVVTTNLTSVPVRMEYYVEMPLISAPEMMDILYP